MSPCRLTRTCLRTAIAAGVKTPVARVVILAALLVGWPGHVLANTCRNAANQLTQYISQVNQVAYWEQSQGIPMKCGWNPMCMQTMMQQLQYWYAQQANFVNGMYVQLARRCNTQPGRIDRGDPRTEVEDITIGLEDVATKGKDKQVRITIPSTPEGFQPR